MPILRYSATSARVKSLSLASGRVNVCVFVYFLFSIRKISPCQISQNVKCYKIAQKIGLEGEKIVGQLVSQEDGKTTQNKSVSILDYMAQKNLAKIAWSGKCFTGNTNGNSKI